MKEVKSISVTELAEMAGKMYGNFVKAVVDANKKLLVVDAEMHVDEEQYLLEHGSAQQDLWGVNLHPSKHGSEDCVEFDSMVNIRPSQNNHPVALKICGSRSHSYYYKKYSSTMSGHRVDRTNWSKMTIFEQMSNIGSEVGRYIKAKRKGNAGEFEGALARTLDLFDATIETLVAAKSIRAREVLRAKDQYLQLFFGDEDSMLDAPKLENYFMQLAVAARLHR